MPQDFSGLFAHSFLVLCAVWNACGKVPIVVLIAIRGRENCSPRFDEGYDDEVDRFHNDPVGKMMRVVCHRVRRAARGSKER